MADPYLSPGASAVDAIDRFLTQREAAKARAAATQHQLQMDKIAVDRETRMEKEAAQADKDRQEARDEAKKDKGYQQTEKRLNDMVPGDIPDPQLVSDAQKYGLGFRLANPRPAMGADFQGPMPPSPLDATLGPETPEMAQAGGPISNIGTPQQRQVVKRETYLDSLMNDPDLDPASKKALEYQRATGQAPPAGIFKMAGTATDTEPLIRVDARGEKVEQFVDGKWVPFEGPVPKGAHPHWVNPPASQGGGADDAVVYSDKAVDMFARMIAKGAPWPPMGNGNKAAANRTRIGNRLADYDKETDTFGPNGSSPDLATAGADYKSNKDAIVKLQGIQAGVDAFAGAAERNAEAMKKVLGNIPDTGNEWANRPYRAVLGAFNNDALKQFEVYRESINNEYNRLLNTVGMTGGITNAMKEDMKVIMSNSSTVPNILSAMTALQTEAKNRHDSYAEQIKTLRGNISSPAASKSTTSTTPAGKKRTRYDLDGNVIPEGK